MKNHLSVTPLAFFLMICFLVPVLFGCSHHKKEIAVDNWQFPVRLGDNRAKVHALLGIPDRVTPELEEFYSSGVNAWFNSEGRVSKLYFAGDASTLYSPDTFATIQSDRHVLFGLTTHAAEATFRQILGAPSSEREERASMFRELHCLWKKDGFLIDALFLVAPRVVGDKTFGKGTLVWFFVSPTL